MRRLTTTEKQRNFFQKFSSAIFFEKNDQQEFKEKMSVVQKKPLV
jgi:hypothetical protein